MEISLLKALLKDISRFNQLESCNDIKAEPIQKYCQKIDEILNLLRPILDVLIGSQMVRNEQLRKTSEELDMLVNEAIELVEDWHPTASKFYFVMRVESLIARIKASSLDVLQLLNSLHQYLPDNLSPTSIEHSMQKLRCIGYEQISPIIKEAIRDAVENSTPSSENMMKIADFLSMTTNPEHLMEAVALEKEKLRAEQEDNETEAKYIDDMISLITLMHDLLVKIKQYQTTAAVSISADFCCPLSLELMSDPVIVASGQTYERTCIRKWLDLGLIVCPKTRQTLAHTNLIPNYTVKALIANWCETNNVEIPDPDKSWNSNETSLLLPHVGSGPRDSHVLPQSTHASTRTNLVRSTELTNTMSSSHKNVLSSSGINPERKNSDVVGALTGDVGNDFGLDMSRISLGSTEERENTEKERNMGAGDQSLVPSKEDNLEVSGVDDQFQVYSRNGPVSNCTRADSINETTGNAYKLTHVSGDITHNSSNASGELTSESASRASSIPDGETEFSPRLMETRSRNRTMWRQPTPRIVSSLAIDTRADLLAIEVEVKKLVKDLQSGSSDLQRAATGELRLLAKHNNDNRTVIASCGAICLLVTLLRSTDIQIQENAVTALLNLSLNDNNKSLIANAGAIEPLICVLETAPPVAKENSAATLYSLSVIEENKARIGRSGAIVPLVELLCNGTPLGKKDAATALFNLSIFHENKVRIVQAGAVKYLVELMDPAAGMIDKAVGVLSNLASIPEGRSAIGHAGGIPVLVEVVELGSPRGKENAAAALLQLCTNSNRFYSMVLQEGAVPPLVALSQSGTPRGKEKAQALISYFRNQRHGNARRG